MAPDGSIQAKVPEPTRPDGTPGTALVERFRRALVDQPVGQRAAAAHMAHKVTHDVAVNTAAPDRPAPTGAAAG